MTDFQSVFGRTNALNMLNAKYIIYNPEEPPLINQNALGNAWFVETPCFVENANEELSSINRIDPSKVAVIDKVFKDQVKTISILFPKVTSSSLNHISLMNLYIAANHRVISLQYFQRYITLQAGKVLLTGKRANISGQIMS